jgi:hypothetical protein
MPNTLRRDPLRRRALALVVVLAIFLDAAVFAILAFEHRTRSHVQIAVLVEHEIVQVFVECRLVFPAYTANTAGPSSLDLGWLERGAIVTIQVRGRKPPGYYEVQLERGSQSETVARAGSFGHPVRIPSGRVDFARSFTAAGRDLGDLGCQSDSPVQLAFAADAAHASGRWNGGSGVVLDVANRLSPVVPWALALIGAVGLILAAVSGRVRGTGPSRRVLARGLGAVVDLVIALFWVLAARDFNVAFGLCVVAGIGSLLAVLWWLVLDDLRNVLLRWSSETPANTGQPVEGASGPRAGAKKDPRTVGTARGSRGGEGATTADGI